MKRTSISNFIFKNSTLTTLFFLLTFVIVALAISQYVNREGFQEGLLSNTAVTTIENALGVYDSAVDTICAEGVKNIAKIPKLSQADSVTLTPLLGDEALKNSAKIDKIIALKSTNDDVKKEIANINSKKYMATLTLLNTINKESYPDDETFTALLKQQTNVAQEVVSGPNSVYSQLKDYLKTIASVK